MHTVCNRIQTNSTDFFSPAQSFVVCCSPCLSCRHMTWGRQDCKIQESERESKGPEKNNTKCPRFAIIMVVEVGGLVLTQLSLVFSTVSICIYKNVTAPPVKKNFPIQMIGKYRWLCTSRPCIWAARPSVKNLFFTNPSWLKSRHLSA